MHKLEKIWYSIKCFFFGIPGWFVRLFKSIWTKIKKFGIWIKDDVVDMYNIFVHGKWQTKVSYLIMGFGSIWRGQVGRGILFLLFEAVFILYMCLSGGYWLSLFDTLGDTPPGTVLDPEYDVWVRVPGDDSFKILFYGLISIIFILALFYTWRLNVKQNGIIDKILADGKKIKGTKDDLRSLVDEQFHKTLLALPTLGIFLFTVVPIIFMVLVAFTSYDGLHTGYNDLFTWVGLDNFNLLFQVNGGSGSFSVTFGEVLVWTLMWAFFATFTNYFLGMLVAMLINKKGIRLKKLWRTILVLTIAIPQFVSLLYVSNLFGETGLINETLKSWGWISQPIPFWKDGNWARAMVIIINIWIGIPYLMLMTSGILMNIPQDLYESAKIDGANVWQQYTRITLPYVLFVTGPYLLTSFIGNINNFNVIYLLSGGAPDYTTVGSTAVGKTDLLITWLFDMTTGADANYKLAAVIGIMIFLVCAVLSLIVYNVMPSTKNEEDYQ
ncbi:MAG: sugar ABC transporter permease [Clostridia bacterium]|nr:sugar ABC transporter permease [Clostridia bacterium]